MGTPTRSNHGSAPAKTSPFSRTNFRRRSDPTGWTISKGNSRLPRDQLLSQLSKMPPQVVDKLTPNGRLPTEQEGLVGERAGPLGPAGTKAEPDGFRSLGGSLARHRQGHDPVLGTALLPGLVTCPRASGRDRPKTCPAPQRAAQAMVCGSRRAASEGFCRIVGHPLTVATAAPHPATGSRAGALRQDPPDSANARRGRR